MASGTDVGVAVKRWEPRRTKTGLFLERGAALDFLGWCEAATWELGRDGTLELELEGGVAGACVLRLVRVARLPLPAPPEDDQELRQDERDREVLQALDRLERLASELLSDTAVDLEAAELKAAVEEAEDEEVTIDERLVATPARRANWGDL